MPFVLNDPTQTSPEVHVDDEGTEFIITLYNENSEVENISAATGKAINFKTPSGETKEKVGVFVTNGSDGKISYTSVEGDIDEAGVWSYQAVITFSNGIFHSNVEKFTVYPNIEIPVVIP